MQKYKLPDKRRFSILESAVKMEEPKQYIHPMINHFDEFPEDQKLILKQIKELVQNVVGMKCIAIFGSRVDGSWHQGSDYDIVVFGIDDLSILKKLTDLEFPAEVDIFVTSKYLEDNKNHVVVL